MAVPKETRIESGRVSAIELFVHIANDLMRTVKVEGIGDLCTLEIILG
jgi:hypothetical protein